MFLVPGLEPGVNGVGDYSRRLATEMTNLGWAPCLVSLNDSAVPESTTESIPTRNSKIAVTRLPATWSIERKQTELSHLVASHHPEWISLQFVNYGFGERGLVGAFIRLIHPIVRKTRWHIMFHELWLGLDVKSSLKDRVWGEIQKRQILKMIRLIRPATIHTHAHPYSSVLTCSGVTPGHLPLFANLPVKLSANKEILDADVINVAVFGTLHPQWDPRAALSSLLSYAEHRDRPVFLRFFGRSGPHKTSSIERLRQYFGDALTIITQPILPDSDLILELEQSHLAFATTPLALWEKSGSIALYLDLGLPTIVTRLDWQLRPGIKKNKAPLSELIIPWEEAIDWDKILTLRRQSSDRLQEIAQRFSTDLRAT
ncbi:MAG: hypothetical protein SynsKO_12950 [Synoicihabitans sp.]